MPTSFSSRATYPSERGQMTERASLKSYTIHHTYPEDAEQLVRQCDFPAMFENPLRQLMYPSSTAEDFEEEIQWNIEILELSLASPDQTFRKACDENGEVLGFACWSIFDVGQANGEQQAHGAKREEEKVNKGIKRPAWVPESLDLRTWCDASKQLAAERRRALSHVGKVWRRLPIPWNCAMYSSLAIGLTMISVSPRHQRRGVGSLLMRWGCEHADSQGLNSFIMASPAALKLYKKFGFEEVGAVEYRGAEFTSMFRKPQKSQDAKTSGATE